MMNGWWWIKRNKMDGFYLEQEVKRLIELTVKMAEQIDTLKAQMEVVNQNFQILRYSQK